MSDLIGALSDAEAPVYRKASVSIQAAKERAERRARSGFDYLKCEGILQAMIARGDVKLERQETTFKIMLLKAARIADMREAADKEEFEFERLWNNLLTAAGAKT